MGDRANLMADLDIKIESVFIPFSKSRNKKEKTPCLNWKVTLVYKQKPVLTVDYAAGIGDCPSYKRGDKSLYRDELIRWECEHGKAGRHWENLGIVVPRIRGNSILLPNAEDVVYCLLEDFKSINYASFEDWALDNDLNPDSIKQKQIYEECLNTALKLRIGLGEEVLSKLQQAFADY